MTKKRSKRFFNWVQHNIRYIAFEDGIAGFKPAKANDVLNKKYGDCKGMANLTRGLLQALGFDARLCWIGTNYIAYDYSTPSMAVDNHMICALIYNGKKIFS
ncbi:MAG: transglutaminase-like domain-containing protein [Chitinophagaceae bacterium]